MDGQSMMAFRRIAQRYLSRWATKSVSSEMGFDQPKGSVRWNRFLETRPGIAGLATLSDPQNFLRRPELETTRTSRKLYAPQDSGPQADSLVKPRRGLPGIASGKEMSALPDSGADHNVITAALAEQLCLKIEGPPADFGLGNSKPLRSLGERNLQTKLHYNYFLALCELKQISGIARLDWSFAERPSKIIRIICHVIPQCPYDLILGRKFLNATRTLSNCRNRATNCLFAKTNAMGVSSLGNNPQRLSGFVGSHRALAIPDTGADRNVMDMR